MATNFFNGSRRDRITERIHFSRKSCARWGSLYPQNNWKASLRYQAPTSGVFHRTWVERRSFCLSFRFQGFFSSYQRVPLIATFYFGSDATPELAAGRVHRFVQVLNNMTPIEEGLRLGHVVLHQIGIRRPNVHAHHPERMAEPPAHLLGEELPHRPLGPILAQPLQQSPLRVLHHCQVHLTLGCEEGLTR